MCHVVPFVPFVPFVRGCSYGPVGLPLSMASTKKVLSDDATFDTPYDAATFFLVMVLRVRDSACPVTQPAL